MPDFEFDLNIDPPPGNEPCDAQEQTQTSDHEHVWEIQMSVFGHKPKYEICLLCHLRRRILPERARVWTPPIGCARTGY
jgi:hypothetical protein